MPSHPHHHTRQASAGDAAEIARLNRLFNGVDLPAAHYAARLEAPQRVDFALLAEVDGQAVGIACLRLLQPLFYERAYAELTELFVEEAFRRGGVGKALLAASEALARQAGAGQLLVLTDYYNHAAQQLYRAAGYQHYDIALCKRLVEADAPGGAG
jgi:GNAT superfamily N-acetyltransferase